MSITWTLLKFAGSLMVALSAVVGVIRAQPYEGALRELGITPPSSECPHASWLGICTGHTTLEDAVAILSVHPWITSVQEDMPLVGWSWSGAQPAWYNDKLSNGMVIRHNRVEAIFLSSRIPYGLIWLDAEPEEVIFDLEFAYFSGNLTHVAIYWDGSLATIAEVRCPMRLQALWSAREEMLFLAPSDFIEDLGWDGVIVTFEGVDDYRTLPNLNQSYCQR